MNIEEVEILIVGAGMAGLMAAESLSASRHQVLVLEQALHVGGRMATSAIGSDLADTGAQFFTARSAAFQACVRAWLAQGLVFQWGQGWATEGTADPVEDGYPRYAVHGGMRALPEQLARGLNVRAGVTLASVTAVAGGWQAVDTDSRAYFARALVLTPPVPQSLALLAAGKISLAAADQAALARITYAPCLTGLFLINGEAHLPRPGALLKQDAPIFWIGDNRRKGLSSQTLITAHAGPAFSERYWNAPQGEVLEAMLSHIRPFLAAGAGVGEARLLRWPYTLPLTLHPRRCLLAAGLPPLAFAGDAFAGPRVEGSALSGLAAAAAVSAALAKRK
ncbi:MAG: NAD(P)/FAD-dependent oxidoreductase [Anaerolineae bacterium]